MSSPEPSPGTIVGHIVVVAEAEVIKAADVAEAEDEDET